MILVFPLLCKRSILRFALLTEVRAQLLFLLFGEVGLHDLKLLALDCLSHPVCYSPTGQQELGRYSFCVVFIQHAGEIGSKGKPSGKWNE